MTGQQRGEGETRDGAHYASVTLKVRDRKEAGGHRPKREQDSVVLLNRLQAIKSVACVGINKTKISLK